MRMFSIPSSRRFICPALFLLTVVAILQILTQVMHGNTDSFASYMILRSLIKSSPNLVIDTSSGPLLPLEDSFVNQYHAQNPLPPVRSYVRRLFSKCKHQPNPLANHIRLGNVKTLSISMVSSDDADHDKIRSNSYFNPAIIPLPAYVTTATSYRYLLVSRLVTKGSHQESHICFSDICGAEPSSRNGVRSCTPFDTDLLGGNGGMRCITKPEKVNIPPTPSKKCTGAWSTFPDIPGFHDPRLFWSGRGEPLIEVNSGSQYGCVGLWIVDLRAIFPQLDDVLKKKNKIKREDEEAQTIQTELYGDGIDLITFGTRVEHQYLTEITRNPRSSRSEVEKNWILFFPSEEEAWVQYDMTGKRVEHESPSVTVSVLSSFTNTSSTSARPAADSHGAAFLSTATDHTNRDHHTKIVNTSQSFLIAEPEALTATVSAGVLSTSKMDSTLNTSPQAHENAPDPSLNNQLFEEGPAKRAENPVGPLESSTQNLPQLTITTNVEMTSANPPTVLNSSNAPFDSVSTSALSAESMSDELNIDSASESGYHTALKSNATVIGGRTLAQLTSHAHTTTNLTSPFEQPCLDLLSPEIHTDALGNKGKWHQSTPSLRLILCTRAQFAARTCSPLDSEATEHKSLHHDEYDNLLRQEGMIVHFSIVHRKFSNIWDLPMRYERYFLVWEARRPFQTIGMSRWPVLFGVERARPWSREEDLGWDLRQKRQDRKGEEDDYHNLDEEEKSSIGGQEEWEEAADSRGERKMRQEQEDSGFYFTYTPSLSWAWRSSAGEEHIVYGRGHEDLGTGYLDEEVIIGIGMDDHAQGFVRVHVQDVLGCMRLCPSVATEAG